MMIIAHVSIYVPYHVCISVQGGLLVYINIINVLKIKQINHVFFFQK